MRLLLALLTCRRSSVSRTRNYRNRSTVGRDYRPCRKPVSSYAARFPAACRWASNQTSGSKSIVRRGHPHHCAVLAMDHASAAKARFSSADLKRHRYRRQPADVCAPPRSLKCRHARQAQRRRAREATPPLVPVQAADPANNIAASRHYRADPRDGWLNGTADSTSSELGCRRAINPRWLFLGLLGNHREFSRGMVSLVPLGQPRADVGPIPVADDGVHGGGAHGDSLATDWEWIAHYRWDGGGVVLSRRIARDGVSVYRYPARVHGRCLLVRPASTAPVGRCCRRGSAPDHPVGLRRRAGLPGFWKVG